MPLHTFECPKGHQFEQDVEWDVDKVKCATSRCRQLAERVYVAPRSPFRQLSTPVVFWKYSDGRIGVAGGADSKTPKGAERVEVRNLGEVRDYTRLINQQHRDIDDQREERYLAQVEAMERHHRSNLSHLMGNESDPLAREIYREALARNKGGSNRGRQFLEYFSQVAEMDSSNRER